jgi:DNA-binding response OmpR family regulator
MSTKAEASRDEDFTEQGKDTESIELLLIQARKNLERAAALQNKKKILVVDDNAYIRDVLSRLLELENFKVVTAEDGRSGIEASEDEDPDLIITDVEMPRLDGVGMIKELRSQSKFNRVPILAITAYGHWAEARAIEAGADRAMVKPIEPDLLFECIGQLLNAPTRLIS